MEEEYFMGDANGEDGSVLECDDAAPREQKNASAAKPNSTD
jgi:hypothetical protein